MKKISIYVLSLNYGGAEKVITNIANMLCDNYDVYIKSIYKTQNNPVFKLNKKVNISYLTDLKPNREEFKSALKHFKLITLFKEGIKSIKILKMKKIVLIDAIKDDNSDIIITTRKDHNYILGKYGKKETIKIGQEHNDFTSISDIRKVIKGARDLDYFMPASKSLSRKYDYLLKEYPVKVVYIPHSIRIPNNSSIKKERQIVAVGRLEPIKAFDDLLKVFKIVNSNLSDLKLSIVGTGSKEEKLKALANELDIKKQVIFKGFLNEEELYKEYEKSLLLVATSLSESFGLIVLEAASVGVPTLAFETEGFKEIINNNENGVLISDRNIKVLADAIIKLLKDDEKYSKLSDGAKTKAKEYDFNIIKTKWIDFIESLLK